MVKPGGMQRGGLITCEVACMLLAQVNPVASSSHLQMFPNFLPVLELSEKQIQEGNIKDARTSLSSMRERYGL